MNSSVLEEYCVARKLAEDKWFEDREKLWWSTRAGHHVDDDEFAKVDDDLTASLNCLNAAYINKDTSLTVKTLDSTYQAYLYRPNMSPQRRTKPLSSN